MGGIDSCRHERVPQVRSRHNRYVKDSDWISHHASIAAVLNPQSFISDPGTWSVTGFCRSPGTQMKYSLVLNS